MMDPATGDVLGIVGGRSHPPGYLTAENFATQGLFQTGSAIKPLAEYTDAIEHRDTPFTLIEDAPFLHHAGKWWPQNDNHVYVGAIPLEYALAISDNNASVRLALSPRVTIPSAWDTAVHQFGLPLSPLDRENTSLAIGGETVGVTPLEMANAYATFANNGVRPQARLVREVVSANGQVLYRDLPRAQPKLTPQVAYVMTTMMEQVITHPGATAYGVADIGRPAAGKTGTTSNGTEGWFCGFTPQLVGCAWEGYPTPTPQPGVYGATYAAPIWRDTMEASLAGTPVGILRDDPAARTLSGAQVSTRHTLYGNRAHDGKGARRRRPQEAPARPGMCTARHPPR
jgi:penicillin-binding protein 1A